MTGLDDRSYHNFNVATFPMLLIKDLDKFPRMHLEGYSNTENMS